MEEMEKMPDTEMESPKEGAAEVEEYVTFHVTAKDGTDVEMAVVDEFEFEKKHYVVACVVRDDEIDTEGMFIYESVIEGEDFSVKQIRKQFDYNRIARAYMEIDQKEKEEN